ncbi:hypothetical protein QJS10_CPA05g01662 [Acorus calamus]|uniref:Uncharacterized protein n=1 Tax=Acorus calamus TaxID=4465 RepID=A0AAV9EVC1_ACOCL|nr:hypothetical protein QJS10_CPA05g01662 [Acorus calamus]
MSFSDDDEGEILPEWVTNYFFMDKNNVPISFAVLPFQSGSYGSPVASAGTDSHIYMIGDVEGEPQKVYKPVNAWKLELSDVTPVVSVQTKGCGHWIKLRKPSNSFKDMVRTVLVTVHCLHYLKWNGRVSERDLWENLSRVFSSYEAMPSKSDILDQMVLVRMAVDRDESLANSEFILEILGKSRNWKNSGEDKFYQVVPNQESAVDDDAIINEITKSADEVSDDESMLYDSVCAICDNGGEILCARHFTWIFDLVEKVSSSITLEDIVGRHTIPSTHSSAAKHIHKTITMGKLEGSVEAVRSALKKLKKGGSTEDAMSICPPEMLKHIVNWRMKLGVYLAPFLHGKRYTSYGRHFTKLDKLKEIVDFSCGANDFSILMKEKLDLTGKTCRFKNYDLVQPKIMGLNPPFGTKAFLANKFIDKALEFKPKLLILSVPEETERLDRKEATYDLIWKDTEMLAGKSYYLPGSVDVNGQQLDQWNLKPPVLYLWGRPDWTLRHRHIALLQEHLPEGSDWSDPIEDNVEAYRIDPLQLEGDPIPLQLDGDPGIDGGYADMLLEHLGQDNQDEAIQRTDPEEKDYGYQEEQIGQEEGTYDNDELLDMSISPPSNPSDQCQVGIRYGNSEVQSSNPSIANDGSTSNYYNQTRLYDHQAGIEYSSQAIMSNKAITGGPETDIAATHEPLRIPVMQNNMPKVDEICHARTNYNPLPFDTPFLDGGNIFDEGSSQRGWID